MLSRDLIKEIRTIEIVTRRLVNEQMAGQYHSVFKGRGMDFDEVRQYQPGDEIRLIDWNVTARMGEVFVKQFVEERELTVMLLVDASASLGFGTRTRTKAELAARIAALFAFSAIKNNDRVGLILFTDKIECFVPPKKGKQHVLRMLTDVLSRRPEGRGTNLASALEFLGRVARRKAVAIVISDFAGGDYDRALDVANRRHDVLCVNVVDPMEEALPAIGLGYVEVEDPGTGEVVTIDTGAAFRKRYARLVAKEKQRREEIFKRLNVDFVNVRTDRPYAQPLVNLFKLRAKRC